MEGGPREKGGRERHGKREGGGAHLNEIFVTFGLLVGDKTGGFSCSAAFPDSPEAHRIRFILGTLSGQGSRLRALRRALDRP